ncbi:hypothetical protein Z948_3151 [Sulfitobacter donghicola DSW-25 = KCTC 12864 = JCM 14565]|nr:hypothetical protein Z948_3151 [Sulfitobacter donghicola DSW-25 = KCTC 12864 = JCM 14565]
MPFIAYFRRKGVGENTASGCIDVSVLVCAVQAYEIWGRN